MGDLTPCRLRALIKCGGKQKSPREKSPGGLDCSAPHAEERPSARSHQPPWRQFVANPIAVRYPDEFSAAPGGEVKPARRFVGIAD